MYEISVDPSGTTFIPNFVKLINCLKELKEDTHTHIENHDFICLCLSLRKQIRPKIKRFLFKPELLAY
jgi:hypothetical protein